MHQTFFSEVHIKRAVELNQFKYTHIKSVVFRV